MARPSFLLFLPLSHKAKAVTECAAVLGRIGDVLGDL